MRLAKSDSSEDDGSAATPSTGHTRPPATHPCSAQECAPAAVPMRDHASFLKSLSSHYGYLSLVEGIRDLGKRSKKTGLPGQCGLGKDHTFQYIGTSTLDIKILDLVGEVVNTVRGRVMHILKVRQGQHECAVIAEVASNPTAEVQYHAHVQDVAPACSDQEERMVEDDKSQVEERQRQEEEERKQSPEKQRSDDAEMKWQLEEKQLEDANEALKEQMVEDKEITDEDEDGKDIAGVSSNDHDCDKVQEEVRDKVKGKKRSKSGGSEKVSKKVKTDICCSSRVRLPSKRAMKD
ncbi:hypothetical protein BDR04DRAFT_1123897 [Suillus decipiens]|nr:hypothetical protein BDR04DRAFT_1123897 [Suillus decipiens]